MVDNISQAEAFLWLGQGLNYTKCILASALYPAVNPVGSCDHYSRHVFQVQPLVIVIVYFLLLVGGPCLLQFNY